MKDVPLAPPSHDVLDFLARVAGAHEELIATRGADPASGLGGRLFYAGDLDAEGRVLVVAANIAGAATLAASADRAAQKQAVRDGIADFLVTSLDEALRILKNQLRKRETVAVCVAMDPAAMEREMNERGVAPDLMRRDVPVAAVHGAFNFEKKEHSETDLTRIPALVVWRTDSARLQDLAKLDEIALSCLDEDEWAARRWLRLAPRYLGRLAQGLRLHATHREFAARFSEQLQSRADRGEITFACEIRWYVSGVEEKHRFQPTAP
jgi:urocanate hydratase